VTRMFCPEAVAVSALALVQGRQSTAAVRERAEYAAAVCNGRPKSRGIELPSGHALRWFRYADGYHGYYEQVAIHDPAG